MPSSDPALDFSAAQGVDLNDGSTTTLPTSKSPASCMEVACTQAATQRFNCSTDMMDSAELVQVALLASM